MWTSSTRGASLADRSNSAPNQTRHRQQYRLLECDNFDYCQRCLPSYHTASTTQHLPHSICPSQCNAMLMWKARSLSIPWQNAPSSARDKSGKRTKVVLQDIFASALDGRPSSNCICSCRTARAKQPDTTYLDFFIHTPPSELLHIWGRDIAWFPPDNL